MSRRKGIIEMAERLRAYGGREPLDGVRILGYRERAWDDHQDVLVFGKPPILPEEP